MEFVAQTKAGVNNSYVRRENERRNAHNHAKKLFGWKYTLLTEQEMLNLYKAEMNLKQIRNSNTNQQQEMTRNHNNAKSKRNNIKNRLTRKIQKAAFSNKAKGGLQLLQRKVQNAFSN